MLTRGKRRAVPGTTTQKSTLKGARSKRSGPPTSKRARTVQNNTGRFHPSQLDQQPFATQAPVPVTSQASSVFSAAVIPALTKAVSSAVKLGLLAIRVSLVEREQQRRFLLRLSRSQSLM